MKKSIALFLIVAVFSMSCATIITGTDQEMQIGSKPAGASFVIYDNYNMEVWNGQLHRRLFCPRETASSRERITGLRSPNLATKPSQFRSVQN